ncbi:hypothetical protein POUND7_008041 [Theobroma cacao]
MEHRQLTSAVPLFKIDQNHNQNSITAEQPYMHRGRAIAPENGSFVYPMENVPRSTPYSAIPQYIASRPLEHYSSNLRLGDSQVHAPHSCPSYDSFPHFPGVGSLYSTPVNDTSHSYSIHHDSFAVCEVGDGLLDCGMNIGRGLFKRKSRISLSCERGGTSRYYSAGSSSNSSEFHPDKQATDYPNYPSGTVGLSHYRGGNLSNGNENPPRNVRSRPRNDLEHNQRQIHPSSYSSHHYWPTAHQSSDSGRVNLTSLCAGATNYNQNNIGISYPTQGGFAISGNTGLRYETNQNFVGESTAGIGGHSHDSVSGRDPVSSAQYFPILHGQAAMGIHSNYSQSAVPSYGVDLRSSQWPQGVGLRSSWWPQETAPTENSLPSLTETYPSRYSRTFSARSWRNRRDTRSRIAAERFQSFQNAENAHDRMGSEAQEDRSFLYGSRNSFDQYRDMRLDVDNMSYEELLALGERIGNVNTGLSEDVMSNCLKETIYSSYKNQQEATCAICLEEYKNGDGIGMMRCGHDYHLLCIKRWLAVKNACPICKAPALADGSKEE